MSVIEVAGKRAVLFMECVSTPKITKMNIGETRAALLLGGDGKLIAPVVICPVSAHRPYGRRFLVLCRRDDLERLLLWFRGLSDGYAAFDEEDVFRKVDGPVVVRCLKDMPEEEGERIVKEIEGLSPENIVVPHYEQGSDASFLLGESPELFEITKPYFIGQSRIDCSGAGEEKRVFSIKRAGNRNAGDTFDLHAGGVHGEEKSTEENADFQNSELRRSILHDEHTRLGASMVPFAGWEMPVRYESIIEEHRAVREKAGLFDISHMGVLEVSGEHAAQFLDTVSSNYVHWIESGESQYGYLLDIDGNVIDDIMIYKRSDERYMVVVNAANNEIDLAWLLSVNAREVMIDREAPLKEIPSEVTIRDLKGKGMPEDEARIDIAIQGPQSLHVLSELARTEVVRDRFHRLQKMRFIETELDGMDILVSRAGYTGEEIGYELFVHPVDAPRLWSLVLDAGKRFGVMPVGLGARDSLRTEAGLPLHGQELAGPHSISPIEAGFGPYVKFHKAFFIGRNALLQRMHESKMAVGRFRMLTRGVRIAKPGDIVVSGRSQRMIGYVTSCAVDGEGIQIGMAYVTAQYAREEVQIGIISAGTAGRDQSKSITELELGDKFPLPAEAVMLSRFPAVKQSLER
jgi:glycine hydroxymethyltransferase